MNFNCHNCGKTYFIDIDANKYSRWKFGDELIQNVFPELSPDERELMISATCGTCFDKLFKEEDDE